MKSIFLTYWSLQQALAWRCGFEPTAKIEEAFQELRELCRAGVVSAVGERTTDHPRGFTPFPEGYRPFLDPPLLPGARSEKIPASEWTDVFLGKDGDLLSSKTRLPIWWHVEVPKGFLVPAWLPIVELRQQHDGEARGRAPAQQIRAPYRPDLAKFLSRNDVAGERVMPAADAANLYIDDYNHRRGAVRNCRRFPRAKRFIALRPRWKRFAAAGGLKPRVGREITSLNVFQRPITSFSVTPFL